MRCSVFMVSIVIEIQEGQNSPHAAAAICTLKRKEAAAKSHSTLNHSWYSIAEYANIPQLPMLVQETFFLFPLFFLFMMMTKQPQPLVNCCGRLPDVMYLDAIANTHV